MKNEVVDYFKEMQGYDYHKFTNGGFVLYQIQDKEFHIAHVYVSPEVRGNQNITNMTKEIIEVAKEKNCGFLSGIVSIGERPVKVTSRLCKLYLEAGWQISHLVDNCIIIKKDLV